MEADGEPERADDSADRVRHVVINGSIGVVNCVRPLSGSDLG
jgi:hypothetical protein